MVPPLVQPHTLKRHLFLGEGGGVVGGKKAKADWEKQGGRGGGGLVGVFKKRLIYRKDNFVMQIIELVDDVIDGVVCIVLLFVFVCVCL